LRYLFPLIVLAILVAYFTKSNWWQKTIVVLSAMPVSIIINGFRIATVGLLYPSFGKKVAEGFFHDLSGWAIFMASLIILLAEMWVLRKLEYFGRATVKDEYKSNERHFETGNTATSIQPTENYFALFPHMRFFLVASMLLGSTFAVAQAVEFRENVPIGRPFNQFPMQVGFWRGYGSHMDQEFIDALDFSDYIMANYKNDSGMSVSLYAAYYESQRKGESIHSPSSCLPGGGWTFHESGKTLVPIGDPVNTTVPVNRAVIQKGDYKQLSYYWFPMRGRVLTNIWEMKVYNFWDALTRQRTDGALVRLITPVNKGESVGNAEDRLRAFMGDIMPVFDEFLPK
jgi:exosortase D (VPLPA-CTERM-specific)